MRQDVQSPYLVMGGSRNLTDVGSTKHFLEYYFSGAKYHLEEGQGMGKEVKIALKSKCSFKEFPSTWTSYYGQTLSILTTSLWFPILKISFIFCF